MAPAVPDWTGVRTQRVEDEAATTVFAQGDPASTVLYLESGAIRLSVVSHAGKEAVVALLDPGHFFGEGCLAGQPQRMATATAIMNSTSWPSRSRRWCGSCTLSRPSPIAF